MTKRTCDSSAAVSSPAKTTRVTAVPDMSRKIIDLALAHGFVDRLSLACLVSTHKTERDNWPAPLGPIFQSLVCPYTMTVDEHGWRATVSYMRQVGRSASYPDGGAFTAQIRNYNLRPAEERDQEWNEWMHAFETLAVPALDYFPVEMIRDLLVNLAVTLVMCEHERLVPHRQRLMEHVFPRLITDPRGRAMFWEEFWSQMRVDCDNFICDMLDEAQGTWFMLYDDPAVYSCDSMAEHKETQGQVDDYWMCAILRVPNAFVKADESAVATGLWTAWRGFHPRVAGPNWFPFYLLFGVGVALKAGDEYYQAVLSAFDHAPPMCYSLVQLCPEREHLTAGYDTSVTQALVESFDMSCASREDVEVYIEEMRETVYVFEDPRFEVVTEVDSEEEDEDDV